MTTCFMTLYISIAHAGLTAEDLDAIAKDASVSNASAGITGMLVHADGYFLQVLEGPEDTVRSLIAAISADSRHTDFHIILLGHAERRNFAEWSMGIVNLDALKSYEVLRDAKILTRFLALTEPEATADAALTALCFVHNRMIHTRESLHTLIHKPLAG